MLGRNKSINVLSNLTQMVLQLRYWMKAQGLHNESLALLWSHSVSSDSHISIWGFYTSAE